MSNNSQVAVVTGAHGGIGAAIATHLAADDVAVACLDLQGADDTVAAIEAKGGRALSKTIDVAKAEDWERVVAEVVVELGTIEYLVASAGVVNRISVDTVADLTEEAWDHVFAVNAKGIWLGMRAVLPSMLELGRGHIVNISSLAAHRGLQGLASYSATKGAVEALTRQAAVEYGRQGVRVNVVAPGTIETPINAGLLATPEGAAASIATTAIGRWGQPDELASIVVSLLREGSFVTGQVFLVDGGWAIAGGVEYGDSRGL